MFMDDFKLEIQKKLMDIVETVSLKNKMNLVDINCECESLFCELLNIIWGFNLQVLNTESNYRNIAVDLGDEELDIFIQVTSNNRREKIQETLEKFSREYGNEKKVKIFIIGKKAKYKKIDTYGIDFNIDNDIWDINTIINKLNDNNEQNRKILLSIEKFYDSGITSICSVYKRNEELTVDKTMINLSEKISYKYGTGDVRIDALIPKTYKGKLSILFTFRKKEVEDAWITFEQKDAEDILFSKEDGALFNRKFVIYEDEGNVWLQLLNVRFSVGYSTAEHLCFLLDDLNMEFNKCMEEQKELLGIRKFRKNEEADVVLLDIPIYVWEAMFQFAQERDYGLPYDEWNMFHANSFCTDRIILYKHVNVKKRGDVLAQLFCKRHYGNYVSILWRPGYTGLDKPGEEFDNIIKWKADYTYNWLIKEFIPRALWTIEKKKHQSYTNYKKNFNPLNYGIYLLQGEM